MPSTYHSPSKPEISLSTGVKYNLRRFIRERKLSTDPLWELSTDRGRTWVPFSRANQKNIETIYRRGMSQFIVRNDSHMLRHFGDEIGDKAEIWFKPDMHVWLGGSRCLLRRVPDADDDVRPIRSQSTQTIARKSFSKADKEKSRLSMSLRTFSEGGAVRN